MRELIQGRAIEELDKLKMKLCLTPDELKIFNKNEDKMKYIRNMKKAEKNETFKNIAEWAVKYNHLKFPKTLQFAPVGYSDGTLRQYFQIAKSYIKDPRPIGRENFTQWLDYFMEEYCLQELEAENIKLQEKINNLNKQLAIFRRELKSYHCADRFSGRCHCEFREPKNYLCKRALDKIKEIEKREY